mmetsp:Transcript_12836/g.22495  ORF Transcript_12836/g.22495 Transcript_12836/m.22495 type:complete len:213 (+) Transcript_12836:78-716(+)
MIRTVTLSTEPRVRASFERPFAASSRSRCLCNKLRTNVTAICGVITSHSPSVAMIANSVMGVMCSLHTSGVEMTSPSEACVGLSSSLSGLNCVSPKAREIARRPFTLLLMTVPPARLIRSTSSALSRRCMRFSITALPLRLSTHMESPTPATVRICRRPSYTAITPVEPDASSSSISILHTCTSILAHTSIRAASHVLSKNFSCKTSACGRC